MKDEVSTMMDFDVFVTMLDVEHTTVKARNDEEALEKVVHYLDKLMEAGIMDPGELMDAKIEIRPAKWNRLENLE